MICEICGKDFFEDWRKFPKGTPRYCSSECSHSRKQTDKANQSRKLKLTTRIKKTCEVCGIELSFGNKGSLCIRCCHPNSEAYRNKSLKRKNYRKDFKRMMVEYKGGKCEICGYCKSINSLQFHHKNPKEKEFNIGSRKGLLDFDLVKNELDKCILVCANCHGEIHEMAP